MTTPTFTPPPTMPARTQQPAAYITNFNAFLAWLAVFFGEMITGVAWLAGMFTTVDAASDAAAASAVDAAAAAATATATTELVAFSNSTVAFAAGTASFAFVAPKTGFSLIGEQVACINRLDASIRMIGNIATAPDTSHITVTIPSTGLFGAGTGSYSSWAIESATWLQQGATAAQEWAQASDQIASTPKSHKDAKAFVALTDAATVTPDGLSGRNFTWLIGGNRTLGAITHCAPGDVFLIEPTQDATGSRILAWAAGVYYRSGGLPVLSTPAASKDYLQFKIITVDGSGTATRAVVGYAKAPSNS